MKVSRTTLLPGAAAALAVLLLLTALGCGRSEKKSFKILGKTAEMEKSGESTRVRLEGSGSDHLIEIKPGKVMQQIDLPVYPQAEVVSGTEMVGEAKGAPEQSLTVRLRTEAEFGDVRDWYEKTLKEKPVDAKILGTRYALFTVSGTSRLKTRTVLVTSKGDGKPTSISLGAVSRKDEGQ